MKTIRNNQREKLTRSGISSLLAPFRWLIIQSLVFFLAAGTVNVARYWIYMMTIFIITLISSFIMAIYMPQLLNRRGSPQKGTKKWDYFILIPYFFILLIIIPLIAGLDTVRLKWSILNWYYLYAGIILFAIASAIIIWSMLTNKHFEGTVRIQEEKSHKVISTGPYSFVRHPGYLGMILTTVSIPLMVGSLYAFIPAAVCVILFLIRTYLEDKTLQNELEGYSEFTKKTKYRIFPGIF